MRNQGQRLKWILALSAKIDDKFGCMGGGVPSNRSLRLCYVNILPQFRTNVSLFESVICLVPAKLWNFL